MSTFRITKHEKKFPSHVICCGVSVLRAYAHNVYSMEIHFWFYQTNWVAIIVCCLCATMHLQNECEKRQIKWNERVTSMLLLRVVRCSEYHNRSNKNVYSIASSRWQQREWRNEKKNVQNAQACVRQENRWSCRLFAQAQASIRVARINSVTIIAIHHTAYYILLDVAITWAV